MFNFSTIGAYKQVRNNPRCKVNAELQNGMVVLLDEVNKQAAVPASATDAQGEDVYVVFNIIDKPEIRNTEDFKIEAGEYVRAFYMKDLNELPVLLSEHVLADYANTSVGDVLVPAGDGTGKWVVPDGTTIIAADYAVNLEVVEKNSFGGNGIKAIVRA